MSVRLGRFMERSGVQLHMTSYTQFAYRKCLSACDLLLYMSHTLQSALDNGQEISAVDSGQWAVDRSGSWAD